MELENPSTREMKKKKIQFGKPVTFLRQLPLLSRRASFSSRRLTAPMIEVEACDKGLSRNEKVHHDKAPKNSMCSQYDLPPLSVDITIKVQNQMPV